MSVVCLEEVGLEMPKVKAKTKGAGRLPNEANIQDKDSGLQPAGNGEDVDGGSHGQGGSQMANVPSSSDLDVERIRKKKP